MPETQEIIATLLQQRTPVSFNAFGLSMHPTIRDGESVIVHPLPTDTLHRGSVILYKIYGRLVLHRLIFNDKRTNRLFMVGDAAVTGGDWIPSTDILGVAESVLRGDRVRRLETHRSRWIGLLRFALRPLRRAIWSFRQTLHPQTPDR